MPLFLLPENEDYSWPAMHDAQYLLGSEPFLTLMLHALYPLNCLLKFYS